MIKKLLIFLLLFINIACFKTNETLTYNLVSEPSTIDPHHFNELVSTQVMNNVYEGLLRLDENQRYVPALAKSYKQEGNKLIFELRDNLKWSDGSDLTIDDIIFSFRRALDPKTAARFADLLYPIKNAKEINEGKLDKSKLGVENINGKLVITLDKPTVYFKDILTLPISFPVKNGTNDDISDPKHAFFSGPYVIKSMDNSSIVLEKNKYYWNKKNVAYEKVKLIIVSDFSVVENLIKNGELDVSRVEPYNLKEKKDKGELINYQNGRVWYLDFNLDNEILKNKENRLVIRNSIDRQKYVDYIKEDGSIVAKSVVSNILSDFRIKFPDKDYFKDNIKSDLLKGKKIRLLTGNTSIEVKEANFIQEELRTKLGLNVEVTTVSFKDRLALTRQKNFDIVLNTYSPKVNDPISVLNRWYNKGNEVYDNMLDTANSEQNTTKRLELLAKAEKYLIDEAIIAPLYYSTENWYVKKTLKNVVVHPITNTMDLFRLK